MKIVLASQSPRRKALLSHLVEEFTVQAADIDETVLSGELPVDYVERLALQKAQCIAKELGSAEPFVVIGSDTTVVFDQHILGKPENFEHCRSMLSMLSGRTHQVYTAFSVVGRNKHITESVCTEVTFAQLSDEDIEQYWATGEPQDKAGAYAIQGIGGKFVKSINGSVSNVVGLPLVELQQVLKDF